MKHQDECTPGCFGNLDIVFPSGEDGLRQSPEKCMRCSLKTKCLAEAMRRPAGFKFEEERINRAYAAGRISFIRRWSKIKYLRQKSARKKEDHNTG